MFYGSKIKVETQENLQNWRAYLAFCLEPPAKKIKQKQNVVFDLPQISSAVIKLGQAIQVRDRVET